MRNSLKCQKHHDRALRHPGQKLERSSALTVSQSRLPELRGTFLEWKESINKRGYAANNHRQKMALTWLHSVSVHCTAGCFRYDHRRTKSRTRPILVEHFKFSKLQHPVKLYSYLTFFSTEGLYQLGDYVTGALSNHLTWSLLVPRIMIL